MSGKWIIIIIIVLGILSLILQERGGGFSLDLSPSFGTTRGSNRAENITPPVDRNNDGVIDETERRRALRSIERDIDEIAESIDNLTASPYKDMVTLRASGARTRDYRDEYVTLEAARNNSQTITITGWKLKSMVSGRQATLGNAALVHQPNWRQNVLVPITLSPGMGAVVATRGLPGFTSFRTNICTGYFQNILPLRPRLSRDCPLLEDEQLTTFGISFSAFGEAEDYDTCIDAIERVPRCTRSSPRFDFLEEDDEDTCRDFIRKYSTYDGCLELHRNDLGFLTDEWRIFLGGGEEIWLNDRETIVLLDREGNIVDSVSY